MRCLILSLLILGYAACGNPQFNALPERDRQEWIRCAEQVTTARCGPDTDPIYRSMCGRQWGQRYIEAQDHQAWLAANGCH